MSVTTRNPVIPGWYADPEIHLFNGRYWIFPTCSRAYEDQLYYEAFSSTDLETWRNEGIILDLRDVPWSTNRAAWAPTVVEKNGKYYIYFSAGDGAGLGVAVADQPQGPYREPRPEPLVKDYHHGAQPIDAHAFVDDDGQAYLIWGGWRHCVMAKLGDDMISIASEIVEITPESYVEGPFMIKRQGTYYLMWSEGSWGDATYNVAYGRATTPWGPFPRESAIFISTPDIASSAGHHSVLNLPGTDEWIVAYHRRPFGETARDNRCTCLERMEFDEVGGIRPLSLTICGVDPRPIG